ncbi:hypothetical protein ACWEHA_26740 [Amycolatopsis nivea]
MDVSGKDEGRREIRQGGCLSLSSGSWPGEAHGDLGGIRSEIAEQAGQLHWLIRPEVVNRSVGG